MIKMGAKETVMEDWRLQLPRSILDKREGRLLMRRQKQKLNDCYNLVSLSLQIAFTFYLPFLF